MTLPLPEGLSDDPTVRAAARHLVLSAFEEAQDIIDTGTPASKLQIIRMLLPMAARSIQTRGDDGDRELKDALEEMNAGVRKMLGGEDDVE